MMFICHKQNNFEPFMNPCQYYNFGTNYGNINELKQHIGQPGIDIMRENISSSEYRTSWIRNPAPVYKRKCDQSGCVWEQIYNKFYPDLRGNQENLINP